MHVQLMFALYLLYIRTRLFTGIGSVTGAALTSGNKGAETRELSLKHIGQSLFSIQYQDLKF